MNQTRTGFSLALLLILAVSSSAIIQGVSSVSTPSVPEFTVEYVDASYDVPATHSIDPYTGADVNQQGYHVKNRTIQVSIKNVPFTAYESGGQKIGYFLNIRVKGSYADDWLNVYNPDNGYLMQSNFSYTTVAFSLDDNYFPFWDNIPSGGTVDIQVQALIGSVHRIQNVTATDPLSMYPWVFDGQSSEWSPQKQSPFQAAAPPPPTPAHYRVAALQRYAHHTSRQHASKRLSHYSHLSFSRYHSSYSRCRHRIFRRAKTQTVTAPPN
jgi:hypothetical protein